MATNEFEPPTNENLRDRLKELSVKKDRSFFDLGSDTTKTDLRQQYRRLAEIHHPDKPGGDADKFRRLTDAYNQIMEEKFNGR